MHRFDNRDHAGRELARRLRRYRDCRGGIVVALPRGGVPVAYRIAAMLHLPLDVMPVRKLGIPGHEEVAMGAIAAGGLCITRAETIAALKIDPALADAVAYRELNEIDRQLSLYRCAQPPLRLQRRTVIVVDDGLATGATMTAAVKTIRNQHPERIVVAVPVGARLACAELAELADEVVCISMPVPFRAVGEAYADFRQTGDDEVIALLAQARSERRDTFSERRAVPRAAAGTPPP